MSDIEVTDTQVARLGCKIAVDCIAKLPTGIWSGWVIYIMELLDDRLPGDKAGFESLLQSVRNAIDVRLERGLW